MVSIIYIICTKIYNIKYTRVYNVRIGPSDVHVLGINATDSGVAGAVTDLHFTVLCFTLGTGEPIMCAIIMKSQRDIASMPESWKLGID